MSTVFLLGVVGLWVAVLWPLWSKRHERKALDASMARWHGALRILSRGSDGGVSRQAAAPFGLAATRLMVDTPRAATHRPAARYPSARVSPAQRTPAQRRLLLTQGLAALFVVSFLGALVVSPVLWVLALPSLAAVVVVCMLGRQVAAQQASRARSHAAARRSAAVAELETAVAAAAPVFAVPGRAPMVAVLDEGDDFVVVDRTQGWSRSNVLHEVAPVRDDPRLVPSAFASARVTGHTGPLFLRATGVDLDAEPLGERDADLDMVVARVLQRRAAAS